MKPFIQDGHTLVLRAVRKLIATPCGGGATGRVAEPRLVIEQILTVDWASATFVGKRHVLHLRIEGGANAVSSAIEGIADGLGEADGAGAGQFLADVALEDWTITFDGAEAVGSLRVEALTIEE